VALQCDPALRPGVAVHREPLALTGEDTYGGSYSPGQQSSPVRGIGGGTDMRRSPRSWSLVPPLSCFPQGYRRFAAACARTGFSVKAPIDFALLMSRPLLSAMVCGPKA